MRILFLDLDTLRPDHLGCYGYHRNTSPNIDKVATEGLVFNNYYCSDAPCLPSRTALMSSKFGIRTGVVGHGGTTADMKIEGPKRGFMDKLSKECLPYMLRQAGFKTISISPFAERHSTWTFYAGFNEFHNTGNEGMESAEEITPEVLDWIDHNGEKDNWFLHINYWDPHTPYRAPEEFGNPFKNDPLPNWLTEDVFNKHLQKVGPHSAKELEMFEDIYDPKYPRMPGSIHDMDGVREIIDGYDCGIKYMDEHIGRILNALDKKGVLKDTAIIISADHGENLGELGIYSEHGTADEITCKVPMIIKWPEGRKGEVDNGLHYNLDLMPTLAEIFNVEPSTNWDGESYAKSIFTKEDTGRDYLVVSQCAHVCQRSVRFDDYLYMRTYHDGFHLFPKEMLFNIKEDPFEQHNIAEENKDLCMKAVYLLNEWHEEMMNKEKDDVDPLWTVIKEGGPHHAIDADIPKYVERLKETDRSFGADEILIKHPEFFK